MDEQNFFDQKPTKATGMLNVLTILTFIGSGLKLVLDVFTYFTIDMSVKANESAASNPDIDKLPSFFKSFYTPEAIQLIKVLAENKLVILIIGLVSTVLAINSAIELRKLKKQGYLIYLISKLLPLIALPIFIGMAFINSSYWFYFAIALLFIILYTTQRKQLIN